MPIGRWEVRLRLEAGLKNDCFLYAYQIMYQILDKLESQRLKTDGKVSQFVAIIDCDELYFRKLSFESKFKIPFQFLVYELFLYWEITLKSVAIIYLIHSFAMHAEIFS